MPKFLATIEISYVEYVVSEGHNQGDARKNAKAKFLTSHPTLKLTEVHFAPKIPVEKI